jgi:hypothetical protein
MRDTSFHYTNEQMVKDLLKITPIEGSILDAGSGKNKVWFNNLKGEKYECELEDGCDFYDWDKKVDWVVGNPPFHESWKFFDKASQVAKNGIAFLINNLAMNSWTPRRYELLKQRGFYLNKIHIVLDKRWFGRYYYLIFTKLENKFVSWNIKTYEANL